MAKLTLVDGTNSEQKRPKFRISHSGDGRYRIGVCSGVDSTTGELAWVRATDITFVTHEEALQAIHRIVANKQWFYDEMGELL